MPARRIYGPSWEKLAFNEWHREASIRRFISPEDARNLTAIDLDLLEYCPRCFVPILLHEVAQDRGQSAKQTIVLSRLAEASSLRALCTLYTLSEARNPTQQECPDISDFRVRRIWPDPEPAFINLSPSQYARRLLATVQQAIAAHDCVPRARQARTNSPPTHRNK